MQNEKNLIDMFRYPLAAIGEIAAKKAEGTDGFFADFAKRTGNTVVAVSVETEKLDDGAFHVKPGVYVTVPEEIHLDAFYVRSDVTELEVATAIAASIISGMLRRGADPAFFIAGAEYGEVVLALQGALHSRTAATNPDESAAILRDTVRWLLGWLYEPETGTH